jgi:hypothetical protein
MTIALLSSASTYISYFLFNDFVFNSGMSAFVTFGGTSVVASLKEGCFLLLAADLGDPVGEAPVAGVLKIDKQWLLLFYFILIYLADSQIL